MNELISQIQKTKAIINSEAPLDWRVQAGHQMVKNEASANLPKLRAKLSEQVTQFGIPVFVNGEKSLELAKEMAKIAPVAVVDLNKVFEPLKAKVEGSLGREKMFGVTQYMLLLSELKTLAYDNGLKSLTAPKFKDTFIANDLDKTIKDFVFEAVGSDLTNEFVRKSVTEQAEIVDAEQALGVLPVLFINVPSDQKNAIVKSFQKQAEITISAETVTPESALEAMESIKSAVKKSVPVKKTNSNPKAK